MHPRILRPGRLRLLVWTAVLTVLPTMAPPARAADLDKLDNSLKLIPADAAFFNTMLRNREQIEAVAQSRAWAKLWNHPLVQEGWKKVQAELNNPRGEMAQVMPFVQMLLEISSEEVFLYGGANWSDFGELAKRLNLNSFMTGLRAGMQGGVRGLNDDQRTLYLMLKTLDQSRELLKVPDFVIGFKVTDKPKLQRQLQGLEMMLTAAAENVPELKGRLDKIKGADGTILVLKLDGQMVPWNQVPIKDLEQEPGEFDKLVAAFKQLKLTLSLGIRNDYLMLGVGGSADAADRLGKGPLLRDRAELMPLAAFAERKLTSVSYASKDLLMRFTTSAKDVDSWMQTAGEALEKAPGLTDGLRKRIRTDMDKLANDLKTLLSEPGAVMGFTFLNGRGVEGYSYDWAKNTGLDSSKPLTLLNHVGGSPNLAVISRSAAKPENYAMLVKWLKVIYGYVDDVVLPLVPAEPREKYQEFTKGIFPLLTRFDDVNRKMLIPALADGQSAFVLDGKLTSPAWVQMQPPSNKPLPMLELALVLGVSDAKLLEQAFGEYRSILNALIAQVQRVQPMQVPDFQIPEPRTQDLKVGTMYYYAIPPFVPLDRQLLPNAGLSKDVAVLTLSESHTRRLLTKKPLETDGGPLADLTKPRASAVYFNWAALVDAAQPWVEYALNFIPVDPDNRQQFEQAQSLIFTGLEVARALRTVSSSTYLERGVTVTHSETVVRDLPPGK